jgi:hypothetical protein
MPGLEPPIIQSAAAMVGTYNMNGEDEKCINISRET